VIELIAINPEEEIYGFGGTGNKLNVIGKSDNYLVYFLPPDIDGYYEADNIKVHLKDGSVLPIAEYAIRWVKGEIDFSKFNIDSFQSSDFLDQLSITFLIKRLQREINRRTETKNPNSFTAAYLKERKKENDFLLNKILEIFKNKIYADVGFFCKKYGSADLYHDSISIAQQFAQRAIVGEDRRIIDELIEFYRKNPHDKKGLRALNRQFRVTPWKTHEYKNKAATAEKTLKTKSEIKNLVDFLPPELLKLLEHINRQKEPDNFLLEAIAGSISEDKNLSDLTTLTINQNSERIYKPNSSISLAGFIFGHKKGGASRLISFLKDLLLKRKKMEAGYSQEGWEVMQNENAKKEYNPDRDYFENEADDFYNGKRLWKKHSKWQEISEDKKEKLLAKISFLPAKQLEAFKKYIGGFQSLSPKERKNFSRATERIKKVGIDIDNP
jgi:hypothetical protein